MSKTISRIIVMSVALGGLAACTQSGLDWDVRGITGGQLDTRDEALQATQNRPQSDARGVLSYPGYQVVLARRGDTVRSVANRLAIDVDEFARYNALKPDDLLRADELLALPRRIDASATTPGAAANAPVTGAIIGGPIATQTIDVTSVASGALDRVGNPAPAAPAASQPARHQVRRGETAYSISRTYNISVRALAEWNGLGPDLALREGQYLIIPLPNTTAPAGNATQTAPGQGSTTPVPPSAAKPLPTERTTPAAAQPQDTPKSPELGQSRTAASSSAFVMPVDGPIIRGYSKGKNDGIDISAAAGTTVRAAANGTVAAITKDTDQVPILVLRHDDNLLSVYAGIDGVKVEKGAKVTRGQPIAVVRNATPSFLHFELRQGVESIDPLRKLQ
jgi:murein DD-endopeptidase MepM/ murein hydrolase activator NlpD